MQVPDTTPVIVGVGQFVERIELLFMPGCRLPNWPRGPGRLRWRMRGRCCRWHR